MLAWQLQVLAFLQIILDNDPIPDYDEKNPGTHWFTENSAFRTSIWIELSSKNCILSPKEANIMDKMIGVGYENFYRLIEDHNYYVDKTEWMAIRRYSATASLSMRRMLLLS